MKNKVKVMCLQLPAHISTARAYRTWKGSFEKAWVQRAVLG